VGHHAEPGKPGEIEPWESDLIEDVAKGFDTRERKELEAELGRRVLQLKARLPPGIRNWESYLAKMLLNKANDWVDARRREERMVPILEGGEEEPGGVFITEGDLPIHDEPDQDLRVALAEVWGELDPRLQRLWETLREEEGNRARTARRLGIHRNTVRLWLREIQRVLERHGFVGRAISHNTIGRVSESVVPRRAEHPGRMKRDFEALEKRRISAMALLATVHSQTEVSRRLEVARETVNRWVKRHRERGILGLAMAGRPGRKSCLGGAQRERLRQLLLRGSKDPGYQTPRWTCLRVASLIKEEFGVSYHAGHVWKLLRSLGWRFRRPIRTWKRGT